MESWVHVEPISGNGNDTVNITVDTNNSSEERSTTINVETSTLNKILTIIQKGQTDMNFSVLSFRKGSSGDITAYLDNSEKNVGEVQQILKTLINAPVLIMYIKASTVGTTQMQFLFADSVVTDQKTRINTITFSQNIALTVSSTDITES